MIPASIFVRATWGLLRCHVAMPLLRLLLAGLVALAAMAAVFFTAMVVLFTGLVGWVMQLFRGKPAPVRSTRPPNRVVPRPTEDVIDVVTTKVPDDAERR